MVRGRLLNPTRCRHTARCRSHHLGSLKPQGHIQNKTRRNLDVPHLTNTFWKPYKKLFNFTMLKVNKWTADISQPPPRFQEDSSAPWLLASLSIFLLQRDSSSCATAPIRKLLCKATELYFFWRGKLLLLRMEGREDTIRAETSSALSWGNNRLILFKSSRPNRKRDGRVTKQEMQFKLQTLTLTVFPFSTAWQLCISK